MANYKDLFDVASHREDYEKLTDEVIKKADMKSDVTFRRRLNVNIYGLSAAIVIFSLLAGGFAFMFNSGNTVDKVAVPLSQNETESQYSEEESAAASEAEITPIPEGAGDYNLTVLENTFGDLQVDIIGIEGVKDLMKVEFDITGSDLGLSDGVTSKDDLTGDEGGFSPSPMVSLYGDTLEEFRSIYNAYCLSGIWDGKRSFTSVVGNSICYPDTNFSMAGKQFLVEITDYNKPDLVEGCEACDYQVALDAERELKDVIPPPPPPDNYPDDYLNREPNVIDMPQHSHDVEFTINRQYRAVFTANYVPKETYTTKFSDSVNPLNTITISDYAVMLYFDPDPDTPREYEYFARGEDLGEIKFFDGSTVPFDHPEYTGGCSAGTHEDTSIAYRSFQINENVDIKTIEAFIIDGVEYTLDW